MVLSPACFLPVPLVPRTHGSDDGNPGLVPLLRLEGPLLCSPDAAAGAGVAGGGSGVGAVPPPSVGSGSTMSATPDDVAPSVGSCNSMATTPTNASSVSPAGAVISWVTKGEVGENEPLDERHEYDDTDEEMFFDVVDRYERGDVPGAERTSPGQRTSSLRQRYGCARCPRRGKNGV